MYKIAKLHFKSYYSDIEKQIDSVNSFLWMLFKNGQIIEGWHVEKYDDIYHVTVCIADDDALDKKYYNEYMLKESENLEMNYEIVCDDPMAEDSCHCKEHSFYILFIFTEESGSPVICGDCGKEIPLIHIPYLFDEMEHHTITNWQIVYESVINLWVDSLSDRFSKRQIINPNSELNKRGLEICTELEKQTGKPCYLFLNNLIGLNELSKNNKELDVCPKCKGKFKIVKNYQIDKVCDQCRLAFRCWD